MNSTTILFILIGCIILVVYSLVNRVANVRTDRRYGAGEHSIVIRYAKGEPTAYTSCDVGEIHEWRTNVLSDRKVTGVDITYANGKREHTTK